MNEMVEMIVNGAETFTPDMLIRLFVFMVIADAVFSFCRALILAVRR